MYSNLFMVGDIHIVAVVIIATGKYIIGRTVTCLRKINVCSTPEVQWLRTIFAQQYL